MRKSITAIRCETKNRTTKFFSQFRYFAHPKEFEALKNFSFKAGDKVKVRRNTKNISETTDDDWENGTVV